MSFRFKRSYFQSGAESASSRAARELHSARETLGRGCCSTPKCLEQPAWCREGMWGWKGGCMGNPASSLGCGTAVVGGGALPQLLLQGRLCGKRAYANNFPQNWKISQSISWQEVALRCFPLGKISAVQEGVFAGKDRNLRRVEQDLP